MFAVISPAKRLAPDAGALPAGIAATEPVFADEATALAAIMRELTAEDLQKLMAVSPAIAGMNVTRFAAFGDQARAPAALLFAGDTYAGLEARGMDEDAWRWAGRHLFILSGLYGLLRPTDLIEPYRLEMGSRLANPRGASLYDWWGNRLTADLNKAVAQAGVKAVVNCASVEYFRVIIPERLNVPVITPVFLEDREGEAKVISFWAKKARGAMARFIMEHRITAPADLRGFDTGGYRYDPVQSDERHMVFRRAG